MKPKVQFETEAAGRKINSRVKEEEELGMKMIRRPGGMFLLLAVLVSCLVSLRAAQAQEAAKEEKANYVKAHYTKYEYRIPVRDGKKLFTSVYIPKDSSQPYPILMQRTPYSVGPYG